MIHGFTIFLLFFLGGITLILGIFDMASPGGYYVSGTFMLFSSLILMISSFRLRKSRTKDAIETYLTAKMAVFIIAYVVFLPYCGFLLSTTIFTYLVSRDYSLNWTDCMLFALLVSVSFYAVSNYVLYSPPVLGKLFIFMGEALW